MTPVGHSLFGLAICSAVLPREWTSNAKLTSCGVFVFLANAPDIPLPGWGHDAYHISHSLFVTLVACLIAASAIRMIDRKSLVPWYVYLAGAGAWLSHLLLDCTYNHGKGLAIFWPLGDGRLALPIPWFSTMKPTPLLSPHNFSVWSIEAAAYGLVLLLALGFRLYSSRQKFSSAEV